MARLRIGDVTSDSIELILIDINAVYDDRTAYFYFSDDILIDTVSIPDGDDEISYVVDGLSPDTLYLFSAEVRGYIPGLGESITDRQTDIIECYTSEEGGSSGDGEWSVGATDSFSNIAEIVEGRESVGEYEFLRIKVTFAYSGTAYFETNGMSGAFIFLSENSSIDEDAGEPTDILVYDYAETVDAGIEYNVKAGTEYYVFYRHYYDDDSGRIYYVITPPEGSGSGRPDQFKWDTPKVKGEPFNLLASEWCRLLDNINAVREYKGYSKMPVGTGVATFTYPNRGDEFTAVMYNQCIYAMSEKDRVGWISYVDNMVNRDNPVTAAKLNFLMEAINSIE